MDTLETVVAMSQSGAALCVRGNHDIKLERKLEGRDVTVSHGLDRTLAELEQQTPELRAPAVHDARSPVLGAARRLQPATRHAALLS